VQICGSRALAAIKLYAAIVGGGKNISVLTLADCKQARKINLLVKQITIGADLGKQFADRVQYRWGGWAQWPAADGLTSHRRGDRT